MSFKGKMILLILFIFVIVAAFLVYNTIAIDKASKEHKDQEKLERLNAELRDCYETVMQNVHMAAYNDAKQAMDALLNEINTIIAVSANGGDPDTAQASGGCSGSCSGCSGCN